MQIVALASDHNAIEVKEDHKFRLKTLGFHSVDLGQFRGPDSVDCTDFASIGALSLLSRRMKRDLGP